MKSLNVVLRALSLLSESPPERTVASVLAEAVGEGSAEDFKEGVLQLSKGFETLHEENVTAETAGDVVDLLDSVEIESGHVRREIRDLVFASAASHGDLAACVALVRLAARVDRENFVKVLSVAVARIMQEAETPREGVH